MKKISSMIISSVLSAALFAGIASAHVTVLPKESVQGKYEVFTVRVPSENKVSPTIKVEVKFPEGVSVSRFEPKPGWKYELQTDAAGKITGASWLTEGKGLSPTEFSQFSFQGKISDQATELAWKAYQTHQDGSVVEWVGAEGSEKPASVTKINPKSADVAASTPPTRETSTLPLYLSVAALVSGLLSLMVSWKKRT